LPAAVVAAAGGTPADAVISIPPISKPLTSALSTNAGFTTHSPKAVSGEIGEQSCLILDGFDGELANVVS